MKQRLRPKRSVSLLHGIIRIAMTSRNSVIASCTPWTVVSRSSLMSLIMTFMFEPAKLQMNCANASGNRARRSCDRGPAASADPAIATLLGARLEGIVRRPETGALPVDADVLHLDVDSRDAVEPFIGRL